MVCRTNPDVETKLAVPLSDEPYAGPPCCIRCTLPSVLSAPRRKFLAGGTKKQSPPE